MAEWLGIRSAAAKAVGGGSTDAIQHLENLPRSRDSARVAGTYKIGVPGLPYFVIRSIGEPEVVILAVGHAACLLPECL